MSNVLPFRKKELVSYDAAVKVQRRHLTQQKIQMFIHESQSKSGFLMLFDEDGLRTFFHGEYPTKEQIQWAFDISFKNLCEKMKEQEEGDD